MIQKTSQFKKDYKLAVKRGCDISKLKEIITLLVDNQSLPEKYVDHELRGIYSKYRECHIAPDWLLIYRIENNDLQLIRTGSHSDLF